MIKIEDLVKDLKSNIVVLTYEDVFTGEIKARAVTMNPERTPNNYILRHNSGSEHIIVWSVDARPSGDWRSYRVNTIKEWRIIEEHAE